ncbi:hypothetical protein GCM10009596_15740 [Arthrobacter rhombi]
MLAWARSSGSVEAQASESSSAAVAGVVAAEAVGEVFTVVPCSPDRGAVAGVGAGRRLRIPSDRIQAVGPPYEAV